MKNNFNQKCKPKQYTIPSRNKISVKSGIIYFCGSPTSYLAYQLGTFPKGIPTLSEARSSSKGIGRCIDSFRPDPSKYLNKSKVYKCKLIFTKKGNKLLGVDIGGRRFFYSPNTK